MATEEQQKLEFKGLLKKALIEDFFFSPFIVSQREIITVLILNLLPYTISIKIEAPHMIKITFFRGNYG